MTTRTQRAGTLLVQTLVLVVLAAAGLRLVLLHLRSGVEARSSGLGRTELVLERPRAEITDRDGRPLATSLLIHEVSLECWTEDGFPPEVGEALARTVERFLPLEPARRSRLVGLFELPAGDRLDLRANATRHGRDPSTVRHRWYWERVVFRELAEPALVAALEDFAACSAPELVERVRGRPCAREERARLERGCLFKLRFEPRWKRHYPLGPTAAAVVGRIGQARGAGPGVADRTVETGLERHGIVDELDELVHEVRRGLVGSGRDRYGVHLTREELPLPRELPVRSLTTTLEADLEEFAHEALARAAEAVATHYGSEARRHTVPRPEPDWGLMYVVDLRNGDLRAAVSWPSFDPNDVRPGDRLASPLSEYLFAPGSIIKPLLCGLAMEMGVLRPGQVFDCCGDDGGKVWRLGRRRIVDDHLIGRVPIERLLSESSNIGAVRVGMLGGVELHERLLALLRQGEAPRIGLPLPRYRDAATGELRVVPAQVPDARRLRARDYEQFTGPSLSFGYQLNIYPLAFVEAFATLVTGHDFRLRLFDAATFEDGTVHEFPEGGPGARRFSPATVRWIRATLCRTVTDERGTARALAGPGVSDVIAGKTGTAVTRAQRGDLERENTASFLGFAPADDPRWLVMATLRRTGGKRFYGGQFAAPPVRDVLLYILDRERRSAFEAHELLRGGEVSASRGPGRGPEGGGDGPARPLAGRRSQGGD
ncbi:MAG: penicillin-binding transpeptidase domain-containing protein [Planctomycetota bacterium]